MIVSLKAMPQRLVFVTGMVSPVLCGGEVCTNVPVGPAELPCAVSAPLIVPT